ncbi:hypothetical protein [Thermococcus sp.]
MNNADMELLITILTPIVTAVMTAYMTSKANEKVLRNIMERVDDLEERIFNHEKRIARLEGKSEREARA